MLRWSLRRVCYFLVAAILLNLGPATGKIVLGNNYENIDLFKNRLSMMGAYFSSTPPDMDKLEDPGEEPVSPLSESEPEKNSNISGGPACLPGENRGLTDLSRDGPSHRSTDTQSTDAPVAKETEADPPPAAPAGPSPQNAGPAPSTTGELQETAPPLPVPTAPAKVEPAANPPPNSSPYTLGQPQQRRFNIRIYLKNSGASTSQNIRLQLPLIGKLNSPYQVVRSETFSREPVEITAGDCGTRCAHFLIPALSPGETLSLNALFELTTYPFTGNFSAYIDGDSSPAEIGYLSPAVGIESNHPEIIAKAEQLVSGKTNNLEKARSIYQFIQQHVRYDPNASCRNQGALAALREKTGVCEEYAALFVALCRASNIPARKVNGYADPKGTGECWKQLNQPFSLRGYRHSWAEFYLKGLGWFPVDPSMNGSTLNFKYFGTLPCSSHIAQNYLDQSIHVKFQGGQLEVTWEEELN